MFDITDPSDVKEIDRIVLKNVSICDALSNYRAILASPDKTSSVLPTDCIRTAAQETTTTQKNSITTDFFPTAKKTVLFREHT